MDVGQNDTAERTLAIVSSIAEVDRAELDRNLELYESGALDSLRTVQLIVALSEEFGIEISPAEFEREKWATPSRIVEDISRRLSR